MVDEEHGETLEHTGAVSHISLGPFRDVESPNISCEIHLIRNPSPLGRRPFNFVKM